MIFSKITFFQIYSWFDVIFVFRPFIFIGLILSCCFFFVLVNYLIYICIVAKFFKKFAILLKFVFYKFQFYFLSFYLISKLIINEMNFHNILANNFLKEIIVKILIFMC